MKKKKEKKLTISEGLSKKITSKKIMKPSKQLVIEIKESKPVEYVSRFFKDELEETKKSLFFQ